MSWVSPFSSTRIFWDDVFAVADAHADARDGRFGPALMFHWRSSVRLVADVGPDGGDIVPGFNGLAGGVLSRGAALEVMRRLSLPVRISSS